MLLLLTTAADKLSELADCITYPFLTARCFTQFVPLIQQYVAGQQVYTSGGLLLESNATT